jgi:hypothetical protein
VISRHETLRTRYVTEAGTPYQVIEPATEVSLPLVDLSYLDESRAREEADNVSRQEMGRALDLEAGPVMRGKLIKVSEQEHELVIVLHHIAADGWSVGLMLQEIAVLYESISTGNPSPLPELPIQYTDFAVWQRQVLREEALEGQLAYWKKQLGGDLPKLDLPTDRRRQDALSIIGEQVSFALPADLSASLNLMARSEGCTLFMTLLAAFQALLHCHTRQEDIIVGTDIANRNHVELEGIIGMFVNMLAMRADLSGDPSFRELLRRARKTSLEAYLNQDLPFDKLVEELRPDRGSHITPIFQVALVLNNMPIQPIELSGGLTHIPLEIQNKTVKFDLVVNLWEVAEGITGHFQYRADLYDARMISQMTDDFRTVIAAVVEQPDVRLSALVEMIDETNRSYRALKQKEGKETRRSKLKRAQPKPISGSK